jgi:methionyl-tRNA formyltransferase
MTPRLDGGPIIARRTTPIEADETTPELEARLSEIGVDAVREAIERLAAAQPDEVLGEAQDTSQATKAPRLSKEDGIVDWNHSAKQIKNQVRAFQPWPGTHSNLLREDHDPVRLILDRVSIADEKPIAANDASPGQIALVEKNRLLVATGDGLLSLDRVRPAGKRPMDIGQWLRGHQVGANDRLGDV